MCFLSMRYDSLRRTSSSHLSTMLISVFALMALFAVVGAPVSTRHDSKHESPKHESTTKQLFERCEAKTKHLAEKLEKLLKDPETRTKVVDMLRHHHGKKRSKKMKLGIEREEEPEGEGEEEGSSGESDQENGVKACIGQEFENVVGQVPGMEEFQEELKGALGGEIAGEFIRSASIQGAAAGCFCGVLGGLIELLDL